VTESFTPPAKPGRYFDTGASRRIFPSSKRIMIAVVVATTFVSEARS
jgi:hypothetical protein